jgi:hypothetical protein
MTALGDLLELIHTAAERSSSVRLAATEWHHHARAAEAFARFQRELPGTAIAGSAADVQPEGASTTSIRLWWEGPERHREEIGPGGSRHVLVRDGGRWWAGSRDWGVVSHETEAGRPQEPSLAHLVDPARLLGALRLEPADADRVAGRVTIGATAAPRTASESDGTVIYRLGAGAEAFDLAVDAERGVLLRVVARLDSGPFHSFEVTEIGFDESFPPETFVHEPEAGDEPVGQAWRPERLPLHQAARRAPFTILAPARVPAGWRLHVTWAGARGRPRLPATAHLLYESEDGAYSAQMRQRDAAEPFEDWLRFEPCEDVEIADAGESVQPRYYVRTVRQGTLVELSGDDRDLLLAFAAALRPAPTEPPRLP